MSDLLLLTHRIPWPPDKGDKIRSYHFFRHLAQRHRVHLGTFVDSQEDWSLVPELEKLCASVCVRPAGALRIASGAVKAVAQGSPVTMTSYRDRTLSRWVAGLATRPGLTAALFFSSGLAPYERLLPPSVRKVLDMVDVDSEKWREYAGLRSWPGSWVYRREARLLARDETALVSRFHRTLLVSADEVRLLRQRCREFADRVEVVPNGVDHDYFSPSGIRPDPFPANQRPIVFTGAMDYWANAEGVDWFARSVLPLVLAAEPSACFYVVGANPTREVEALGALPGVVVTGRVTDVRPYLAHARVAVAPLRIARGLQNKVLEAMAMARPVVATPAAMRGIDRDGEGIATAGTDRDFARAVLQYLNADGFLANRQFVIDHFSWPAALSKLDDALEGKPKTVELAGLEVG